MLTRKSIMHWALYFNDPAAGDFGEHGVDDCRKMAWQSRGRNARYGAVYATSVALRRGALLCDAASRASVGAKIVPGSGPISRVLGGSKRDACQLSLTGYRNPSIISGFVRRGSRAGFVRRGSERSTEGFPSGQRDQTVNLTALPSKVRILPPPPTRMMCLAWAGDRQRATCGQMRV